MVDYVASLRFRSDSREIERSEKDLKGLERQSGRTERAASGLGRTLRRVFAGVSVGLVARQIIRNTIEQEKATTQLNATLRSTGRFSEETSQALLNYAEALQSVTTFGDEAIITAQSQLLTFTKLGNETFPRATEAVLDMATKMGGGLKQAVVQVGKALQDPIRGVTALREVGVDFSDAQREVIKRLVETNRVAEAQSLILDELETEFGGSARAARDTFGGALQALKNQIGDLLEGDTQSGGLKGATEAFNSLTDALNDPEVQQGFDTVISGIGRVLEAAARAPQILGHFGDAVRVNVTGTLDPSDLDQVNLTIERVVRNIEFLQSAVETGAAGQFGHIFTASIRRQKAQLEQLKALQAALREQERGQGDSVPDSIPGLDIFSEVTVLGERRDKEFEEIKERIARGLKELAKDAQQADDALQGTLRNLSAELGGPMVQAVQQYEQTLAMLTEQEATFRRAGELTIEREQQLALARQNAKFVLDQQIEAERERLAALEAQLSPAEQLIADLEFEVSLITLGNKEREKEIALRYAGAEATEEQRQRIEDLIGTLQEEAEASANLDQFRSAFSSAFAQAARDIRNVDDALKSLFDRILNIVLNDLGDQLAESLFGAFGSSQVGGSVGEGGGFWANLIGSLFGGGRALGGPVHQGRFYEVAERGPELLESGGKQYLIPNQSGKVTPITNHNNYSRRSTTNVTITRPIRRETVAQLATEIGREQRLAMRRNQ